MSFAHNSIQPLFKPWYPVVYALMKSSRLPGAQGRISLALSEQPPSERPTSVSTTASSEAELIEEIPAVPRPRGWWDYVPEPQLPPDDSSSIRTEEAPGLIGRVFKIPWRRRKSKSWEVLDEKSPYTQQRAPVSPPQTMKRSTVRFSESIPDIQIQEGSVRAISPAPSGVKSLRHLMSRMKIFRKAMRNEVCVPNLHPFCLLVINFV